DPDCAVEKIELGREEPIARRQRARDGPARRHPQGHVPAMVDPGMEAHGELADQLQQQVRRLDRALVDGIVELRPGPHGVFRALVAAASTIQKRSSESTQRAAGVQPPASSSVYCLRRSNLWLFSVWMVSPRAIEKRWPETSKAKSSMASRCISIRA